MTFPILFFQGLELGTSGKLLINGHKISVKQDQF